MAAALAAELAAALAAAVVRGIGDGGRAQPGCRPGSGTRGHTGRVAPHEMTGPMTNSRLSLLAAAGVLALAGQAGAADTDTRPVDTYLAITGLAPDDRRPAAGELAPLDARVVALGEGSAVVYYTYDPEGADMVRVVTTVGTEPGGAAAPVRFVSHLSPGQKAEVSVAGAAGTEPAVLELAYEGGLLRVRSVAAAARPEG